jgi:hypothetical protein
MDMTAVDCVVILGDSTSAGFARGGRGYPVLVGEALGAIRVENLSKFGQTTKLMVEEDLARIGELRPDVVIVQAGIGDSLPIRVNGCSAFSSTSFPVRGTASTVLNVAPTTPVRGAGVPGNGRWPNSRPHSSGH